MNTIRNAGVSVALLVSHAMGLGTATWTISVSPTDVAAGTPVNWSAAVSVSTDTRGLANYVISIEVRDSAGSLVPITLSAATFAPSFKIDGLGPAEIRASYTQGGPEFDGISSTGVLSTPGRLAGASASLNPPFSGSRDYSKTWGIGLDERKSVLLADPAGPYTVNSGSIPTTGLAAGAYTVKLISEDTFILRVLKGTTTTPIDYSVPLTNLPSELVASATGSQAVFTIGGGATGGGGGGVVTPPSGGGGTPPPADGGTPPPTDGGTTPPSDGGTQPPTGGDTSTGTDNTGGTTTPPSTGDTNGASGGGTGTESPADGSTAPPVASGGACGAAIAEAAIACALGLFAMQVNGRRAGLARRRL